MAESKPMSMKEFSIAELQHYSGIKAHTIRAWELRYGFFAPRRGENGFRVYTVGELRKLLQHSLLNRKGMRISCLVKLSESQISQKVEAIEIDELRWEAMIFELIIKMHQLDPNGFERVLQSCYDLWPVETVAEKVLFPFVTRVNLMRQGRRANEEHLAVTLIQKQLFWIIRNLRPKSRSDRTVLLFLSDPHQLDLLLLFAHYHFSANGWNVLYLGLDVSVENVQDMIRMKKPDMVFTYFSRHSRFPIDSLLSVLQDAQPKSQLVLVDEHSRPAIHSSPQFRVVQPDDVARFLQQEI